MLPFCPSPFFSTKVFSSNVLSTEDLSIQFSSTELFSSKFFSSNVRPTKISQYSFSSTNFSHQSSFHQCSLNKDLSIQFFLNRSFFLNKSSTVGRTSPQHISLIVSTSNCYVEIKRMSALWFTFGRVLSDLEGSILGNSTNPLGVRWGRSDSERCSPPSSFPSVHLLTTFPFFTPLMWISPLTFHLFALKRAFSGEFPHLSTTFLSPSAICVQRDTSTFCSSWSTTGFQNQF